MPERMKKHAKDGKYDGKKDGRTDGRTDGKYDAKRRLDSRQNVAIAVLAVLAVFLFSRTEIFTLGRQAIGNEWLPFPDRAEIRGTAGTPDSALRVPVRVCVTGNRGRYASLAMTAADAAFPADIFALAFRDAVEWEEVDSGAFDGALGGASVYIDFLNPLPLSLLAGLTDAASGKNRMSGTGGMNFNLNINLNTRAGTAGAELTVRRAVLYPAPDWSGVMFCVWDGAAGYYRRVSSVEISDLEAAVRTCENAFRLDPESHETAPENPDRAYGAAGRAFFAMDNNNYNKYNNNYNADLLSRVAGISLLLEDAPYLPVLSMRAGLADTEQLLTALRFNPRTNFRYMESNGTEVVVDGSRSVRIRANGSVYYQSGGRPEVSVESSGENPDFWEAAAGCAALLDNILTTWDGGAPVYPMEAASDGGRVILRFGYQMNGVPIRFPDGGSAAVAVLEGRAVVSLELRPRRYIMRDEISLLPPLRQALGVADGQAEISPGYLDTGASRLSVQWLAGK